MDIYVMFYILIRQILGKNASETFRISYYHFIPVKITITQYLFIQFVVYLYTAREI